MLLYRRQVCVPDTLTPFLYPAFLPLHTKSCRPRTRSVQKPPSLRPQHRGFSVRQRQQERLGTESPTDSISGDEHINHLDPPPHSYSVTPFTDRCVLQVRAGAGGHGCVSFLREKYIPDGPPNGGDGGSGGSIYIQAVPGETSLHKLARRGIIKAGRGKNGRGSGKGGERGADVIFTVPVGTVVRELDRLDPVGEELAAMARERQSRGTDNETIKRDKFVIYPGPLSNSDSKSEFAPRVKPRKPPLAASEPRAPIALDLDSPMERPMLLAAGAVGGLGNPHFVSRNVPKPKYATKGSDGLQLSLHLELKILADVGLVGLPNAGKSTLLRAISNSRTRVGNWAFTTLQPNVGTVVLDDHSGRPPPDLRLLDPATGTPRTSFTVADIPGLIEDAHMDRGLGFAFLRHVERASILAFVVDLSAGDAVAALKALWREVAAYETLRSAELNAETERVMQSDHHLADPRAESHLAKAAPPISAKPWFVVATKADIPETQKNFAELEAYVQGLQTVDHDGSPGGHVVEHPSGRPNAWRKNVRAVPVSAINAQGVDRIPRLAVDLLR